MGARGPQFGHGPAQAEQRFDRRANPGQWAQARGDWRGAHSGWNRSVDLGEQPRLVARPSGVPGLRRAARRLPVHPGRGLLAGAAGVLGPPLGLWRLLPRVFWQYQVYDWAAYGLPPPPLGCAWVWIDGGVALVDLSDGYILDVQNGLW